MTFKTDDPKIGEKEAPCLDMTGRRRPTTKENEKTKSSKRRTRKEEAKNAQSNLSFSLLPLAEKDRKTEQRRKSSARKMK